MASSPPPTFRIATVAWFYWRRCSACSPISKSCSPTAPTRGRSFTPRWPASCLISKPKSSNARIGSKASSRSRSAGSSSAPSPGLTAAGDWPRTGRTSTEPRSPSSSSPPSASCSENSATPDKVPGRTLNACWDPSEISWTYSVGPLHVAVQHTITGGIPNISDDTQKNSELAGRNCVTNEVFWRLSTNLYNAAGPHSHYLNADANVNKLFGQAKNQNILFDDNGLVFERFYGLPKSSQPTWTWLGDQGLFLSCCYFNKFGDG